MTDTLSAVECAFYAFLVLPVLYLLFRHRAYGLMGWLFLSFFCIIRIVGAALSINPSSGVGTIISNVGLSPMLLATAGILHEARLFRLQNVDPKVEAASALLFHFPVVAGVALAAAGSAKLQKPDQTLEQMEKAGHLAKAGIAILTVCWGILVLWTCVTLMSIKARSAQKARIGSTLLWAIVVALAFIGVRVFYSVVLISTGNAALNPTTGEMGIRVALGFVMELIATIIYISAGLMTQKAAEVMDMERSYSYDASRPHSGPYV